MAKFSVANRWFRISQTGHGMMYSKTCVKWPVSKLEIAFEQSPQYIRADFLLRKNQKHKAKEQKFKSFKRADFSGNDTPPHRYDGGHPLMEQAWKLGQQ